MKKQMVTISQILDYLEAKAKRNEKLTGAEQARSQDSKFDNWMRDKIFIIRLTPRGRTL